MDPKILKKACQYRRKMKLAGGVVLVFDGEIYGWKNRLRDPQCEQPGAVAIDSAGNAWLAIGGDSYNGAACWSGASEAAQS